VAVYINRVLLNLTLSIKLDEKFYMNKLLKFGYYNISLGLITWLVLFLYKINIWLTVISSIILIYLFVIITSKFLTYVSNL